MKRKSLIIPIFVFIISFTVLSFYQKSQNNVTLASTTDLPPVLWSKTNADISKVVYRISDKKIVAERKESDWFLSNINNKKADSLYIYTTITSFLEPHFKEVIELNPKDLTLYGIDATSPVLTLSDMEGNEYSITRGNNINKDLTYVYTPVSDTVYTMERDLFDPLSLNQEDWFNKDLLNLKIEDVHKVTFSYKGLETTLLPTQTEKGITFSSPHMNDALSEKFISFLENSKIEQFITDNASAHILQVYGFNNPSLRCTVYLSSGDTLSLIIGNIKEDENICYAMVNHNNGIVAIPYFDFSQFDTLFAELESTNSLI